MSMSSEQVDTDEKPCPPRPYTPSYFACLLLVTIVWLPVPLSWAYVVYSLYTGRLWSYSSVHVWLFAISLVEVFFTVYQYHLAREINASSPRGGHGSVSDLQAAFTRVLQAGLADLPTNGYDEDVPGSPAEPIIALERQDPRALDFRTSLRTWFGKRPWSEIRLHQVQQWLYWSMYNAALPPREMLPDSHRVLLDDTTLLLEKRAGCQIEKGSNPACTPMRLTLDHVYISFRPFMWYVAISMVNRYLRFTYQRDWGLTLKTHHNLDYLIRVPEGWTPATGPRPICLLHGLGLGLFQYSVLVKSLLQDFPDRPLLIPVQPHISQDIFHPRFLQPMSRHRTADEIASLFVELGWVTEDFDHRGITVLSHSNGSYVHAWLLKSHPRLVARSCFCDPVTFASWEGDVCYNFIYRPSRTGIELLMKYFVGSELGVANTLQRHFQWANNSLFYEEIPNARDPTKTFFLVGGQDAIVNAERVKKYLTSHGIKKGLWFDPEGHHGQALMPGGPGHAEVVQWLKME